MSIDYDLFIIKSDNEDTTHSQLRDCIADAIENLQLRIELLENGDKEKTKSKEPIIKDEKIRKAVRAWAEANDVKKVTTEKDFSTYAFYPADTDRVSISVWIEPSLANLSRGKIYTITELCGEEEE